MQNSKSTLLNKAFTLVELIVVIIILSILGTIAFISLQGYSKDARDSSRVSDLSSIKTSLELFELDAGKYPQPTDGVDITYSGGLVWKQGTFGEDVFTNVDKLDKIPLDPLTDSNYTYSVTIKRNEYELGGIMEGDTISLNSVHPSLLSNGEGIAQMVNAAGTVDATAYVTGNYNGIMSKSLSGTTCNILSIPTIITNDTQATTDLEEIITQERFVYSGKKNLPSSFKSTKFNNEGGFTFSPNKLLSYTDNESCSALGTSETSRIQLLKNLQTSYDGISISSDSRYNELLTTDINVSSPSYVTKMLARTLIGEALGLDIPIPTYTTPVASELPTDLTQIFDNASSFTTNWQSNTCDPNAINVVELSPGTDVIPANLTANTVYKLSSGDYISTYRVYMDNCSAIIGTEDNSTNFYTTTQVLTAGYEGAIQGDGLTGVVIYGLNIDGTNDGQGGSHAMNYGNLAVRGIGSNATIYKVNSFNANVGYYVWGSSYDLNNIYLKNVKSYNNDTHGAYILGNNVKATDLEFYSINNTGLEVHWQSNDVDLSNILAHDNSSYGVFIGGNNVVAHDITVYSNVNGGIQFNSGDNGTFYNIKSYNNTGAGVYFNSYTNSIGYNVKSYNNTGNGINVSGDYNTFYNMISYNNGTAGFELGYYNKRGITLSNVASFNNSYGYYLRQSNSAGNIMNNIVGFNNSIGLYAYNTGVDLMNNISVYNNNTGVYYPTQSNYNYYYGIAYIFENSSNNTSGTNVAKFYAGTNTYAYISTLGLSNGTQDNSPTFSSDYEVIPSVSGWSAGTKTKQTGLTFDGTETYTFGISIPKQTQPLKYNTGTLKYEYYGTNGVEFDTTKYIGEF